MKDDYKKIIEAIEKTQKIVWENEKKKKDLGTRKNPYIFYQSSAMYEHLKKHNLIDENDMYLAFCGWTKVVVVDLNKEGV